MVGTGAVWARGWSDRFNTGCGRVAPPCSRSDISSTPGRFERVVSRNRTLRLDEWPSVHVEYWARGRGGPLVIGRSPHESRLAGRLLGGLGSVDQPCLVLTPELCGVLLDITWETLVPGTNGGCGDSRQECPGPGCMVLKPACMGPRPGFMGPRPACMWLKPGHHPHAPDHA